MKKVMNFYTAEDLATLRAEVLENKRPSIIIKEYSKKWNRSAKGLALKVNQIRKAEKLVQTKTVVSTKKVGRPRKDAIINKPTATIQNGVTLPSGFVFDFAPKRAEMHSDHVRLFF